MAIGRRRIRTRPGEVIGCRVDRLALSRADDYRVSLSMLRAAISGGEYDLIALVNPNSPPGQHVARAELEAVLHDIPPRTRVWIDETCIEYVGREQSLECFAARSEQVIICKSMSKTYALSGLRAAYLCAAPHQLEALRAITPPWAISALHDPAYSEARYGETAAARTMLVDSLAAFGWDVVPGVANFLLCHLPESGADAATVARACEGHGLFLREADAMGSQLGPRAIRIAVKDVATNRRMTEIVRAVIPGFPVVAPVGPG